MRSVSASARILTSPSGSPWTGELGGSILGRHLQFEPRVTEAQQLHSNYSLHAAIDISDGLALDAWRMAAASDCGVVIDLSAIPVSQAAVELAGSTGKSPHDHALGDGEDFELLLAAPPAVAAQIVRDQPLEAGVSWIGEFVAGDGLFQRQGAGPRRRLEPTGFLH